jgi:3-oxoacyl-[acyl-carrier protein] reductase
MMDLKDKIALITGASGSIGGSCARLLHSLGAHVIISGTNVEKLEKLATELGGNCTIKPCDLSNHEACEALINGIDDLDILVCNAGITHDSLSMRMSIESFEKVLNINLTSSFILNKAAIKKMMKKQYGRIINISSVVGVSGNPGQANYCASKAGLIGMSKSMAQEVAKRNITINCVAPGFIHSDMTEKLTQEQKDLINQKIPAGHIGSPEDVANSVAFLASDKASYINGSTIHVNGGMLMV